MCCRSSGDFAYESKFAPGMHKVKSICCHWKEFKKKLGDHILIWKRKLRVYMVVLNSIRLSETEAKQLFTCMQFAR